LSDACAYGCKYDDEARSIYSEVLKANHSSFTLTASSLLLDPSSPFVGTSPDGIVECSCCGCGVLEIKCPYSCKYQDRADEHSIFLEEDDSRNLQLKESHPYYYQVQLQMKLYGTHYCDFAV